MPTVTIRNRSFGLIVLIALWLVLNPLQVVAQEEDNSTMQISEWLMLGPAALPLPAYHQDSFKMKDLLAFEPLPLDGWWPQSGQAVAWDRQQNITWTAAAAGEPGITVSIPKAQALPYLAYLAAYIDADRWCPAELTLTSRHLFKVYLDGSEIASKQTSEAKADEEAKALNHSLKLETGKHLLLVKLLRDPENPHPMSLNASLKVDDKFPAEALQASTSPRHFMNITHLLEGTKVAGVSIAAEGDLAAVTYRRTLPPEGKSESWMEIIDLKQDRLLTTYRGKTALSSLQWAPSGRTFAYTENSNSTTTLWIVDLSDGSQQAILEEIKDFGGYSWSPDGSFIIYSINEEPAKDERGVKRFQSPRDKWPGFRTQSFLYRVNLPEGTRQRLTAGKLTTSLSAIRSDGRKLLFTQTVDDFENRPYTRTVLASLDLEDLNVDTLLECGWMNAAEWSPDGRQLLLTGSPDLFGTLGWNVPDGMAPNDYDGQAYLYDLETKTATAITRDFDPAVDNATWSHDGSAIYLSVGEKEFQRLYRYTLKDRRFQRIDTGVDVLNTVDFARHQPLAVYYGSSVSTPHRAYFIDLSKQRYRVLADPEAEGFRTVDFGEVKPWTFQNARGETIDGRVYYPPNFDPNRQYPCIVYYYGGTSVVTRDFGGRYPKNLFAAQGYVVYVLQPSGAPGYGQAFSAYHVNDWGNIVAEEIISGTKAFLDAHPFVDKSRVGCIGASYGGFMTMNLLTKTDIYAAGISHAGISALSSYWGEGFWGYLYSSVASANSFPWNRRDLYVDHSPLFNADKVTTPLLLLHGDSDTNVPRGESDQFYLALKLLGKTVEYVQVAGQDHHILDYKKRIIWQKTILAWFDRYLKGQPEWWGELYPEP